MGSREPPTNLPAEQAVLGAILSNNKAYDLCGGLQSEHFAYDVNAEIFRACQRRIQAGQTADAITLWPTFKFTGLLDECGGIGYLTGLLSAMVGMVTVPSYADAIRDAAARRAEIAAAEEIIERAYGSDLEHGDASATAAWGIEAIERAALLAGGAPMATMATAVRDAMAQAEAAQRGDRSAMGLFTGIQTLDDMWGGLYPGSLDIIGARSKTGKTSLAMQIARKVATELVDDQRKGCVLISTLEMPARDLGMVNVSSLTGISADDLRRGKFGNAQAHAMILAEKQLARLPIEIIDRPAMPLGEMIGEARSRKRTKNLVLWIIDHRNLIGRDPDWKKASKLDWYQEITQRLKAVSKMLAIPVLLLVQIGRAVENRDDPRPRLSDLEYAGEQDCDNCLLLFRPELHAGSPPERKGNETAEAHGNRIAIWHQERRLKAGIAEIILAKRRFGAGGICTLKFSGATTTFGELPLDDPGPPPDLWDDNHG